MLTEKTKAGRESIVARIVEIAESNGASWLRDSFSSNRCLTIRLYAPGGLGLDVSLDGDSPQIDTFVLPWCVHHTSDAKLDTVFGINQKSTVDPFHQQKCTAVAFGTDQLFYLIEIGLFEAVSGIAYQDPVAA